MANYWRDSGGKAIRKREIKAEIARRKTRVLKEMGEWMSGGADWALLELERRRKAAGLYYRVVKIDAINCRLRKRSICKKTENFIASYVLVLNNKFPCFMYPETKITNIKFIINAQKTHPSTMTATVHDITPMGACTEMGSFVFSDTFMSM